MADLFFLSGQQILDSNGDPVPGAKAYFYAAGTTTPQSTFSNAALTTPNTNPVVADGDGRFGAIFLQALDYKIVVATSADVTIYTLDDYTPPSGSVSDISLGNNEMLVGTGAGTAGFTTTSYMRGLLNTASKSALQQALDLEPGVDIQAYDAGLADIAGLAVTDGNFIVGDGANWVAESGSTARASLGLGSIATQAANNVAITGGTISGTAITAGDTGVTLQDNADATKQVQFELSGITTGTTRTLTVPDASATLALTNSAQTISASHTFSGNPLFTGSPDFSGAANKSTIRSDLGLAIGTNVQAYDAELAAIAGLTSAADRLPYFNGSGTAALATFTSFGRSLVDDADASAARTTLGVVIGTDVQAQDAFLQNIADLSDPNADRGLFWDDSAGAVSFLTYGSGLTVSGTTLSADVQSVAGLTGAITASGLRTAINVEDGADVTDAANVTTALGSISINALSDVDDTGKASGEFLKWNGTNWVPDAIPGGGDLLASNNLSDVANAATARTNLGVAIGTNVQAYDAGLQSIAGLTTAADRGIYTTASDVYATFTLTAAGRALLDDADASAQRSTLALGSTNDVTFADITASGGAFVATRTAQTSHIGYGDRNGLSVTNVGATDFYIAGGDSNDLIIASRGNSSDDALRFGNESGAVFTEYMAIRATDGAITTVKTIAGVKVVATVSAMEALTTSNVSAGDTVHLRGYSSANDNGGGHFKVLSGSATSNGLTVDDGIVFENTAGDLTFVRVTAPYSDHVAFDTWFGAAPGNSAAANTTAYNNLANWIRTQSGGDTSRETVTAIWAAGGTCQVNSLDYTQIKSFGWAIKNYGTTIKGVSAGKTVLDLAHSRFGNFYNLHIEGDSTNRPAVGIGYGVVGMRIRNSSGVDAQTIISAGNHQFFGCCTSGEFTTAAVHNLNSEEVSHYGCRWENDHTAAGGEDGLVELRDGRGAVLRISDYVPLRNSSGDCFVITDINGGDMSTSYANVWTGVYSSAPTTRADGSALVSGDYYTNNASPTSPTAISSGGTLYKWNGSSWATTADTDVIIARPENIDGSFVCCAAHQCNWIKDGASTGPAIRIYGPGGDHNFPAGNYVAAPDGETAIAVDLYGGSELNRFDFSAHVEIPGLNYAVTVETDDGNYDLGGWRIADHNSFADTALIHTTAASGTINLHGLEIEVDQFNSGTAIDLFSTPARFRASGKITTRQSAGIAGLPTRFCGDIFAPDADNVGTTTGEFRIFESNSGEVLSRGVTRVNQGLRSIYQDSVVDDTAFSFDMPATASNSVLMAIHTNGSNAPAAMIWGRATGSPACVILSQVGSTGFAATTGVLAGTTGADNKITVSAHTDGKIYIENRYGPTPGVSTLNFSITFLSVI